MKHHLFYILLLIVLATGCDSVRIFEPVLERQTVADPVDKAVLINARVVSDPNHSWQYLDIYTDGLTVIRGHRLYLEKSSYLSAQELQTLQDRFVQHNFMQLPSSLIDKSTIAPLTYVIDYHSGAASNQVCTNDLVNNSGLAQIVAALDAVVERVVTDGLVLTLEVSPTTLRADATVLLRLILRNTGSRSIQLSFQSDQLYRFNAYRKYRSESSVTTVPNEWIGAAQENFLGVQEGVLRPGEALTFSKTWDGKDEKGMRLLGDVAINAELLTVPGGITAETMVKVE
jgi:hypothetical protein